MELSSSVHHLIVQGRDVYLVGTAHVSAKSVEDVRNTADAVKPDSVCIELCQGRYKMMTDPDSWKKMDIFKVIRQKKGVFLLSQLIMSAFYRKLGEKLGIEPGAEMREGIKVAEELQASLVLADRNIQITLKRVWRNLRLWDKFKLATSVLMSVFSNEKIDSDLIEQMKNTDQLENIMSEFTESFPEIKRRLIDERDIYLAQKIRAAKGQTIMAVVGAGHVPGIKQHIETDEPLDELIQIPPKSIWPTLLKWAIPIAIILLFVYGFHKGGAARTVESIWIWILVNGILSAVGATIALGHPLTILASFLGAPLTSLNPTIAAGWVAGLVQAFVRRPKVADFQELPKAISSVKGFWTNPVTRILLVVVLANLGSMLGTYIALGWIAARTI